MNRELWRRHFFLAAILVPCLALAGVPKSALATLLHAKLLRSSPAADARLTSSPQSIRLAFSEAVVAELSQIVVTGLAGTAQTLPVSLDPRDSHVLIGDVVSLSAGTHKVAWRIVSADGHPVAGNFSFSLIALAADSPPASPLEPVGATPDVAAPNQLSPDTQSQTGDRITPKLASVLRGLGLGSTMAGVGLLLFGGAAGARRNLDPGSLAVRLLAVGALLLAGHMAAWLYHISPGRGLSETFGASALMSTLGMIESARVLLAVLAFWAMTRGRRQVALTLGLGCLALSGAVGHSAAIQPMLAIPAKIVHLTAGSVWLGGLLWLGWTYRRDMTAFRIEARRVSFIALLAWLAVAASGVAQAYLFLDGPRDLIYTSYGRLVVAKIGGLLVLTMLGAYNRFRLVPYLDDSRRGRKLSRSVTQELAVMAAIILVSGFLANVPIPASVSP
jgi:copper transport protein